MADDINWNLCLICQTKKAEDLGCPLHGKTSLVNRTSAYENFLRNIKKFQNIDQMPVCLRFDPDNITVDILVEKMALWHVNCHLKFSNTKLERATERYNKNRPQASNSSTNITPFDRNTCLFCGGGAGKISLCQILTL